MAKHRHKRSAGRLIGWVIAALACVILACGSILVAKYLNSNDGTAFLLGIQEKYSQPTEIPTSDPTPSPTATPEGTVSPTPSPTPSPTATPKATPTPEPTAAPTPEPPAVQLDFPYLVEVDKGSQIVTVFTLDAQGKYTVPVKYMLCSTGRSLSTFKEGLYKTKDTFRWRRMLGDPPVFAQYCVRISGSFLFHSLPYTSMKGNALKLSAYEALGTRASGGCIRLLASEAKWLYDNLPVGTPVRITVGEPNEALWNELKPSPLADGVKWDPSDPDPENPVPSTAPGSQIRNTPYPGVTPAPLDEPFSKDVPRVTPRATVTPVPAVTESPSPQDTPTPGTTPAPTGSTEATPSAPTGTEPTATAAIPTSPTSTAGTEPTATAAPPPTPIPPDDEEQLPPGDD